NGYRLLLCRNHHVNHYLVLCWGGGYLLENYNPSSKFLLFHAQFGFVQGLTKLRPAEKRMSEHEAVRTCWTRDNCSMRPLSHKRTLKKY
ncbi:MAG: hypothetical protein KDD50_01985, partial [Bdellovibrionales bacterium]|nr:hypothetical protein [Bdellovibrionales bacterium]